jgi:FkbM family methyltransferase
LFRRLYACLKPRGVVTTTFRGFRVAFDADDPTHEALLLGSDFNDPEFALLERHVRPGMTVVDIGANIGCYTLVLSSLVGETGVVVAFEPGPDNVAALRGNVERNGVKNVRIEARAVSDRSGTATLELSRASGEHRLAPSADGIRTVQVPVTTLDEALEPLGYRADIVKMDAQGAEFAVLRGMTRTLEANRNLCLLVEFDPEGLRAYHESPTAFATALEGLGFRLNHVRHDLPVGESVVPIRAVDAATICERERRHINLWCVRDGSTSP